MRRAQGEEPLTGRQRGILVGIVASFVLVPLIPIEILAVAGLGVGWWLVPKFWRTVLLGAVGGGLAGVIILGWGFRLAMRVVAILDPFRTPEFTLEGTLFILILIGGVFGALLGVLGNLATRGFQPKSVLISAIVPAIGAMALIFAGEDTRMELFELGAGPWLNLPMFGFVSYAFGVSAAWITRKIDGRITHRRGVAEPTEVRT